MFSNIRKRLTYTNLALTLALVFAMTGGAYAAKKYLITSTKQISPAVLKQLQGKTGSAGAPGAQGPAGSAGPAGPVGPAGKGEKGEKGDAGSSGGKGENGTPGARGVTGVTGLQGEDGADGTDGKNGSTGPTGPEGSPWTLGGTLPSGKTETGAWGAAGAPATNLGPAHVITASISFTIPLAKAPAVSVILLGEGENEAHAKLPTGCKGNVNEPKAELGHLCIFAGEGGVNAQEYFAGAIASGEGGGEPGKTGALVFAIGSANEDMSIEGTWAVTAQ